MPTRTLLVARWTDVAVAAAVLIARRIEFGGGDGTGGGSRDRSIRSEERRVGKEC